MADDNSPEYLETVIETRIRRELIQCIRWIQSSLMAAFFTLDRLKTLQAGQTVSCVQSGINFACPDGRTDPFQAFDFVKKQFPAGFTSHGKRHFLDWKLLAPSGTAHATVYNEPIIELVFELVRRVSFPACPSRYQSFFAWERIEDALEFRRTTGHNSAPVFRVEATSAFRADMRLLTNGGNALSLWLLAERYWTGEPSISPVWEVLLTPPVFVAEQVG